MLSLSKGSPAEIILGPGFQQEEYDAYDKELGFSDPFFVRYFRYVGNLIRGDFGRSYVNNVDVLQQELSAFFFTFRIILLAGAIEAVLSVLIGCLC